MSSEGMMKLKNFEIMLQNHLLTTIYPKDKSEKSAKKLADIINSAVGVAEFKNDKNESIWGVLVNKNNKQEANKDNGSELQNDPMSLL